MHCVTERSPTVGIEPLAPGRARDLREMLGNLPNHAWALGGRQAAVLVPLYEHDGHVHVVLTRRSESMPTHAGQISFPGGARDDTDDDLLATAIRESEEEIGLPAEAIAPLGLLGTMPTYANEFIVSAYVASITRPEAWIPSEAEIDEIIELSLDDLARVRSTEVRERDEFRWVMPVFHLDGHRVWGFTAFILARLLDLAYPVLVDREQDSLLRIDPQEAERVVRELHDADDLFDWAGIYWLDNDVLTLGPFRGAHPAGHEVIKVPAGVCGAVALTGISELVPDVRQRAGHIACDISTRSEMVVPIKLEGRTVGVLDVDSNTLEAFDEGRVAMIEAAASRISAMAFRP